MDLGPQAWEEEIADLRRLGLLAHASHHAPDELDAHPLAREHFGERLRTERPEAWRAGHGRLYEHLKKSAKELPDTLAEMTPLFQAMHHGCQAGRHQEALYEVYWARSCAAKRPTRPIGLARSVQSWRRSRACSIRPGTSRSQR